jgi:hypothetical protein
MYRVIDTISYNKRWTDRYPHLVERGDGLLAILEPTEINAAPDICGRTVSVHKPNGERLDLIVDFVEAPHAVVGLFFKGASSEDIPRESRICW